MVAALTTSLPETPGGERNWDYRFCWIRDATFTLWSLHVLGLDAEANDFARFIGDVCFAHGNELQIMYGIGGERDLTESTLDHLSGYGGATPVRIGNGAFSQRQNDVYGALVDSLYIHAKANREIPAQVWPIVCRPGRDGGEGLAPARPGDLGGPRRAQALRLLEADVLGGARPRGAARPPPRRRRSRPTAGGETADEIHADILANGVSERGVLRQHYDTDALDASNLLAPLFRFLPPDHEVIRATVLAIADELTDHGLVLRYRVEETDDGLHGEEGTFTICSFWLVSALSEIGEAEHARALCERLLCARRPARPLRRGDRAAKRHPPRQLPAGVHPPGADQRRRARGRRRAARGRRAGPDGGLHRDAPRVLNAAQSSQPKLRPAICSRRARVVGEQRGQAGRAAGRASRAWGRRPCRGRGRPARPASAATRAGGRSCDPAPAGPAAAPPGP